MTKIPEGWIEGILSDIVFIQPGFAFKSKDFDVNEGEYVIKIKNIHPPFVEIYENDIVNINGYDFEKLKKFQIKKGDYLIAMTGETIGKVGKYTSEKVSYLNQRVCKLTDIGKANYQYISYILQQESFQKFIDTHSFGAAQANISTTEIGNFQIVYPQNPQEQKAIAGVLSAFDDKIELLRAENQTLEEMGQTLFKERFGKYKVGDELPDGWKVGKLGNIIDFIIDNRGKTPLTSDKGDYPMVEINSIIGDSMIIDINNCKKFVDQELYDTWFRKGHPKRGDVLFSTVGSIGEIAFVFDEVFCIAQNIVGLRSKFGKYMYLLLKSIQGNLKTLDISSVQPSIKLPHLLDYDIIIPEEKIIKDFEDKVSPIFEKINNNGKEINTLISTRDQLLPKLMSGEVRVEF